MKANWIKSKPTGIGSDPLAIMEAIEQVERAVFGQLDYKFVKYYISKLSIEGDINQDYASSRTLKSAIKSGHSDISVFMYANPLSVTSFKDKHWRKQAVLSHQTENFVMDLERSCFDTIDELLSMIEKTKTPEPSLIVKTGPRSYQMLYRGVSGAYPYETRLEMAKILSGCQSGVSLRAICKAMEKVGVSIESLKRDLMGMKIRMPLTINYSESDLVEGGLFITSLWVNPSRTPKINLIKNVDPAIKNFRKYSRKTLDKINFIERKTRPIFGKRDAELYAEVIGSGMFRLIHHRYRIHQANWGKLFGIPQYSVSRKLRKLIDCGIIMPVADYKPNVISKTYGAGPELIRWVAEYKNSKSPYNFYRAYKDGAAHAHILKDIRAMVFFGWKENKAVEFIMEKQANRKPEKRRSLKEIRKIYQAHVAWIRAKQISDKAS